MPRLIDANALKVKAFAETETGEGVVYVQDIDEAPTVDAVEVVHGKWEKAEYNGFLRCDQCKDVYINEEWLADGKWNYCPNCGADMRGSEE